MGLQMVSCSAVTTQDADPFELSVSCVGVVPSLAPAEFCTTSPHRRYQNIFCEWSSSPLNVSRTSGGRTAGLLCTWDGEGIALGKVRAIQMGW